MQKPSTSTSKTMPYYSPKKVVLNWFKYDISFSIQFLSGFVENTERHIDENILGYQNTMENKVVFFEHLGEEHHRVVQHWRGLDTETWNIKAIVHLYFPNLQRKSALITVFGYFEHELNELCSLYKSEKSFQISPSDLKGQGIDRSMNYLEKVVSIDTHRTSIPWNEIKNIQRIRNLVAHQDGRLYDGENKPIKSAKDYIKQTDTLDGDTEVIIKRGYLKHVLNTFRDYFSLLDKSIQNSERS